MSASELPRLLTGVPAAGRLDLYQHLASHGPLPAETARGAALIDAISAAGLRGRGGAAFPTGRKLAAVAERGRRRELVVNAAEGEPLSDKDAALLELAPHLVLDGALLAAEAIGARQSLIAVKRSAIAAVDSTRAALAERRDARSIRLALVPDGYVASEESALLRHLGGGPAKPTSGPRPFERGLNRRPTLVANAETLAHVALIARHGSSWFRGLGTEEHPGSALITLTGAVERPGVREIALGTPIARVIGLAGGHSANLRGVLIGGYGGSWLTAEAAASGGLDDASLARRGARLGAGVVFALGREACPVAEVTRVVRWMADQTAGQCGPCVHGLDAIADALASVLAGTARPDVFDRLERWSGQVERRGACHHPDGVARFLRSALVVFATEFKDHRRHGPCDACGLPPVLVTPSEPVVAAA
jgi:NADH:ubiquinone oxidoreductase subunit F (NADH-binding)